MVEEEISNNPNAKGTKRVMTIGMASAHIIIILITLASCNRTPPEYVAKTVEINRGIAQVRWENETPEGRQFAREQSRIQSARVEEEHQQVMRAAALYERQEAARLLRVNRPSEIAECRSRGNASFGSLALKISVMNDCLAARRLRREGR